MMKSILVTLLVLVAGSAIVSPKCFTPNGKDRNAQVGLNGTGVLEYAPCDSLAKHSMCCAIGRKSGEDTCKSDGLCYNEGSRLWWRESCTDPTWQDPACIKLFVNGTGLAGSDDSLTGVNNVTDIDLTPCDNGSWCSGSSLNSQACCKAGLGYFIAADGTQTRQNPNVTSTTSSSPTSSVPTLAPSTPSHPTSKSTTIGIAIGASLGGLALIIIACVAFLCYRRRRRSRTPILASGSVQVSAAEKDNRWSELGNSSRSAGKGSNFGAVEVPGQGDGWRTELGDGTNRDRTTRGELDG